MDNLAYKESLAYDFTSAAEERQLEIKEHNHLRTVETKRQKKARKFVSVRVMLVTSAVVAAMVINGYATLTSVSDKVVKLNNDIEKLANEEISLKAQSEKMVALASVEGYVQENLAMTKMNKDQVEYVELANPDTIMLQKSAMVENGSRVFTGVQSLGKMLWDYLT